MEWKRYALGLDSESISNNHIIMQLRSDHKTRFIVLIILTFKIPVFSIAFHAKELKENLLLCSQIHSQVLENVYQSLL